MISTRKYRVMIAVKKRLKRRREQTTLSVDLTSYYLGLK